MELLFYSSIVSISDGKYAKSIGMKKTSYRTTLLRNSTNQTKS